MSTVHICLHDILGVAVKCEVIFYPGDTPFQNGAAMAVSGRHSVWLDADGNGSVELLSGSYAVRFGGIAGNTDTLMIQVPNDDEAYELPSLITAGNWVLPMRDFMRGESNLADVADPAAAFAAIKQAASAEAAGVVQLASQAEVDAGTDAAKAVTPATLAGAAALTQINAALAQKADASALEQKADLAALPKTVIVADASALLALTVGEVNAGDLVVVTEGDSGATEYYEVIDVTQLGGYAAFGALRGGPAWLDGGKVQSDGQGRLHFYSPDDVSRMRVTSVDKQDGFGAFCGTLAWDTDYGPTELYTTSYGEFGVSSDSIVFTSTQLLWNTVLTLQMRNDFYPVVMLPWDKMYVQGAETPIVSFETDGLHINKSAGFFGKVPVTSQPAAIANATDLTSALNAINRWLTAARSYGMIAS